jgi:hypothetical protein
MYNVIKGWPSNAALDFTTKPKAGVTVKEGDVVMMGKGADANVAVAGNFTTAAAVTDNAPAFVIGADSMSGNVTALMGRFIVEIDAVHYAAASYAAGDVLTAKAGKFAKATTETVIGKVLTFNATTGIMTILWIG